MKLSLKLIAEKPEDNMLVRISPEDTLKIDGKNIQFESVGETPLVIVTYNTTDNMWHGYSKKFKTIEFK